MPSSERQGGYRTESERANPASGTLQSNSRGNNQFAIRFFKAVTKVSPQENVLTAPSSLSYAFALLLNGSTGPGQQQIAEYIGLNGIPLDRINQGNAALRAIRKSHVVQKSTLGYPGAVGENGRTFQPYRIAGALWVPKRCLRPIISVAEQQLLWIHTVSRAAPLQL